MCKSNRFKLSLRVREPLSGFDGSPLKPRHFSVKSKERRLVRIPLSVTRVKLIVCLLKLRNKQTHFNLVQPLLKQKKSARQDAPGSTQTRRVISYPYPFCARSSTQRLRRCKPCVSSYLAFFMSSISNYTASGARSSRGRAVR